jgi:hypothetical protein
MANSISKSVLGARRNSQSQTEMAEICRFLQFGTLPAVIFAFEFTVSKVTSDPKGTLRHIAFWGDIIMNAIRTLSTTFALAAAALGLAGTAHAQSESPQIEVRYGDLDLATAAGRAKFQQRVAGRRIALAATRWAAR